MDINDIDIYDDLDEFQEKEEKKTAELLELEKKYKESLETIAAREKEIKRLRKERGIIEVNFQNLLDTAKREIKRKDDQIAQLQREKDDILFRRKVPPAFMPHKAKYKEHVDDNIPSTSQKPPSNPFKQNVSKAQDCLEGEGAVDETKEFDKTSTQQPPALQISANCKRQRSPINSDEKTKTNVGKSEAEYKAQDTKKLRYEKSHDSSREHSGSNREDGKDQDSGREHSGSNKEDDKVKQRAANRERSRSRERISRRNRDERRSRSERSRSRYRHDKHQRYSDSEDPHSDCHQQDRKREREKIEGSHPDRHRRSRSREDAHRRTSREVPHRRTSREDPHRRTSRDDHHYHRRKSRDERRHEPPPRDSDRSKHRQDSVDDAEKNESNKITSKEKHRESNLKRSTDKKESFPKTSDETEKLKEWLTKFPTKTFRREVKDYGSKNKTNKSTKEKAKVIDQLDCQNSKSSFPKKSQSQESEQEDRNNDNVELKIADKQENTKSTTERSSRDEVQVVSLDDNKGQSSKQQKNEKDTKLEENLNQNISYDNLSNCSSDTITFEIPKEMDAKVSGPKTECLNVTEEKTNAILSTPKKVELFNQLFGKGVVDISSQSSQLLSNVLEILKKEPTKATEKPNEREIGNEKNVCNKDLDDSNPSEDYSSKNDKLSKNFNAKLKNPQKSFKQKNMKNDEVIEIKDDTDVDFSSDEIEFFSADEISLDSISNKLPEKDMAKTSNEVLSSGNGDVNSDKTKKPVIEIIEDIRLPAVLPIKQMLESQEEACEKSQDNNNDDRETIEEKNNDKEVMVDDNDNEETRVKSNNDEDDRQQTDDNDEEEIEVKSNNKQVIHEDNNDYGDNDNNDESILEDGYNDETTLVEDRDIEEPDNKPDCVEDTFANSTANDTEDELDISYHTDITFDETDISLEVISDDQFSDFDELEEHNPKSESANETLKTNFKPAAAARNHPESVDLNEKGLMKDKEKKFNSKASNEEYDDELVESDLNHIDEVLSSISDFDENELISDDEIVEAEREDILNANKDKDKTLNDDEAVIPDDVKKIYEISTTKDKTRESPRKSKSRIKSIKIITEEFKETSPKKTRNTLNIEINDSDKEEKNKEKEKNIINAIDKIEQISVISDDETTDPRGRNNLVEQSDQSKAVKDVLKDKEAVFKDDKEVVVTADKGAVLKPIKDAVLKAHKDSALKADNDEFLKVGNKDGLVMKDCDFKAEVETVIDQSNLENCINKVQNPTIIKISKSRKKSHKTNAEERQESSTGSETTNTKNNENHNCKIEMENKDKIDKDKIETLEIVSDHEIKTSIERNDSTEQKALGKANENVKLSNEKTDLEEQLDEDKAVEETRENLELAQEKKTSKDLSDKEILEENIHTTTQSNDNSSISPIDDLKEVDDVKVHDENITETITVEEMEFIAPTPTPTEELHIAKEVSNIGPIVAGDKQKTLPVEEIEKKNGDDNNMKTTKDQNEVAIQHEIVGSAEENSCEKLQEVGTKERINEDLCEKQNQVQNQKQNGKELIINRPSASNDHMKDLYMDDMKEVDIADESNLTIADKSIEMNEGKDTRIEMYAKVKEHKVEIEKDLIIEKGDPDDHKENDLGGKDNLEEKDNLKENYVKKNFDKSVQFIASHGELTEAIEKIKVPTSDNHEEDFIKSGRVSVKAVKEICEKIQENIKNPKGAEIEIISKNVNPLSDNIEIDNDSSEIKESTNNTTEIDKMVADKDDKMLRNENGKFASAGEQLKSSNVEISCSKDKQLDSENKSQEIAEDSTVNSARNISGDGKDLDVNEPCQTDTQLPADNILPTSLQNENKEEVGPEDKTLTSDIIPNSGNNNDLGKNIENEIKIYSSRKKSKSIKKIEVIKNKIDGNKESENKYEVNEIPHSQNEPTKIDLPELKSTVDIESNKLNEEQRLETNQSTEIHEVDPNHSSELIDPEGPTKKHGHTLETINTQNSEVERKRQPKEKPPQEKRVPKKTSPEIPKNYFKILIAPKVEETSKRKLFEGYRIPKLKQPKVDPVKDVCEKGKATKPQKAAEPITKKTEPKEKSVKNSTTTPRNKTRGVLKKSMSCPGEIFSNTAIDENQEDQSNIPNNKNDKSIKGEPIEVKDFETQETKKSRKQVTVATTGSRTPKNLTKENSKRKQNQPAKSAKQIMNKKSHETQETCDQVEIQEKPQDEASNVDTNPKSEVTVNPISYTSPLKRDSDTSACSSPVHSNKYKRTRRILDDSSDEDNAGTVDHNVNTVTTRLSNGNEPISNEPICNELQLDCNDIQTTTPHLITHELKRKRKKRKIVSVTTSNGNEVSLVEPLQQVELKSQQPEMKTPPDPACMQATPVKASPIPINAPPMPFNAPPSPFNAPSTPINAPRTPIIAPPTPDHAIFHIEPESGPQYTVPALPQFNHSQDKQLADIDSRLFSMFQSPPYVPENQMNVVSRDLLSPVQQNTAPSSPMKEDIAPLSSMQHHPTASSSPIQQNTTSQFVIQQNTASPSPQQISTSSSPIPQNTASPPPIPQNTASSSPIQQKPSSLPSSSSPIQQNSASSSASHTEEKPLNDSLNSKHAETKRLSLGTSQYVVEKISENVVTVFVTRKRHKRKTNLFSSNNNNTPKPELMTSVGEEGLV